MKLLCFNDDIAPIGRMKLAIEVVQVGFNGFRGDTELVRDLLVTQPFLQKQQHLEFAIGLNFAPIESFLFTDIFLNLI